jgi:hypothetical protein
MKQFKFFQKPVKGDLTMMDGQTFSSMSFNGGDIELPPLQDWDTPQGHNGRRRLYHTNPAQYEIQRQIREELRTRLREGGFTEEERIRYRNDAFERMRNTNDDMERYFIENSFRGLTRDLNDNPVEQVSRVINGGYNLPKLKWHQRFLNELMDDNKPHKLILLVMFILFGITVLLHYYTQR